MSCPEGGDKRGPASVWVSVTPTGAGPARVTAWSPLQAEPSPAPATSSWKSRLRAHHCSQDGFARLATRMGLKITPVGRVLEEGKEKGWWSGEKVMEKVPGINLPT